MDDDLNNLSALVCIVYTTNLYHKAISIHSYDRFFQRISTGKDEATLWNALEGIAS